jgi:hypothetical protein
MQKTASPWWKTIQARFLSRGNEFRRNPAVSWKAILVFLSVGVIAVLATGYITYYRAIQDDGAEVPVVVPRSALRAADVEAVREMYQGKKERWNALLSDRPTFLSPERGAVVTPPSIQTTSTSSEGTP